MNCLASNPVSRHCSSRVVQGIGVSDLADDTCSVVQDVGTALLLLTKTCDELESITSVALHQRKCILFRSGLLS